MGREQNGDEDRIMNDISNVHYLDIVDELGYFPVSSNTNQIIYNSIKKSLERNLGKSGYAVLIGKMCSVSRLSENELTTNYELFEKLLNKILHHKRADIILNWIKQEMLIQAILKDLCSLTKEEILNPNLTINDIIADFNNLEIIEFIRKIPAHEHIVFLYNNEDSKDKALAAFFDSTIRGNASRGLISVKPITNTNFKADSNVLFEELFLHVKKSAAMKKMFDWIYSLYLSSKAQKKKKKKREEEGKVTRVALDDATWFFRNSLGNDHLLAEKSVGKRIQEKISMLCMYNISNMTDLQIIKKIMAIHSYVILDSPFIVYKSGSV